MRAIPSPIFGLAEVQTRWMGIPVALTWRIKWPVKMNGKLGELRREKSRRTNETRDRAVEGRHLLSLTPEADAGLQAFAGILRWIGARFESFDASARAVLCRRR